MYLKSSLTSHTDSSRYFRRIPADDQVDPKDLSLPCICPTRLLVMSKTSATRQYPYSTEYQEALRNSLHYDPVAKYFYLQLPSHPDLRLVTTPLGSEDELVSYRDPIFDAQGILKSSCARLGYFVYPVSVPDCLGYPIRMSLCHHCTIYQSLVLTNHGNRLSSQDV
jgi:hypothetical protein